MHFLPVAAVFLLTAVLLVPLFKRLKLGAVLGYLAAGMLIGPWGLGLIGGAHDVGGPAKQVMQLLKRWNLPSSAW